MDKNQLTIKAYDDNFQHYSDKFDDYGVRVEDIDRAIKLNESGSLRALELGCGNGRDAEYIVKKVGETNYTGIDASKELLKIAQDRLPKVDFRLQDMREVDVSPETYGIVFAFASLLHVNREETVEILKKCHKSLKNGGVLYITTKFGEYREIKINNMGDEKYYYSYIFF